MKKCIIEAPFTFDAGPPIISVKYAFYKEYLGCDKFKDMDGALYKYLEYDLDAYTHLLYLSGGMTFSYPFTAVLPFNIIPFEDLYSIELLVAIIYLEDYSDELKKITQKMGLDFHVCYKLVGRFISFLQKMANELCEYDRIYICCERPAAVFSSILTMHFVKSKNKACRGVLIGKHATTPAVRRVVEQLNLFEEITNEDFLVKAELKSEMPYARLSAEDFELDCYSKTRGMRIISYSVCKTCPYKCKFCSIALNWNGEHIYRSELSDSKTVEQVKNDLERIKEAFGVSLISFCDCTMNYTARNQELFAILRELNMLYTCTSRADLVNDDFCKGLIESNFVSVVVGVESLNPKTIELMGKGGKDYTELAVRNCKRLYEAGMDVQINSLICYPYETYNDVKDSLLHWEKFTSEMKANGIIIQKIPVGTLTLNYPSQMYFDVLNDERFEKYYHNVESGEIPQQVRNAIKDIPYYAVDKDKAGYEDVNKMDFVLQIYNLWNQNVNFLDTNLFYRLMQCINVYIEAWDKNRNVFTINSGKLNNVLQKNHELNRMVELIKMKKTDFSDLSKQMYSECGIDERRSAQMVLLLLLLEVLEIH